MRIPRIYYPGKLYTKEQLILPLETSHYLLHVLRMKLESSLCLFNGDGNEYFAHIIAINKKLVQVNVDDVVLKKNESGLQIHLLQGLSRGDRMDFTLQKAVELGVSKITPLITEYCQLKLDEMKFQKKMRHWQSIIVSACEQSGRSVLPTLEFPKKIQDVVKNLDEGLKLICHPGLNQCDIRNISSPKKVSLLVGPEGGLSTQEVTQAIQQGFLGITLGPRILRTETAALVGVTILQYLWGDMGLR